MSRLFWFALGAAAGMAYATRTIHQGHLDLAPGETTRPSPLPQSANDIRTRLAQQVEDRARTVADLIQHRGEQLADAIRAQNVEAELPPIPRMPSIYGQPAAPPVGYAAGSEVGLEEMR